MSIEDDVVDLPYFFGNNELYDLFSECGKVKNYAVWDLKMEVDLFR